jgi:hypothetical protein
MGYNQGYLRLVNGFVKTLNASEKKRGWLFITKDKKGLEMITPHVNIRYKGAEYYFPVDNYGRVMTGTEFISNLPETFNIVWHNGDLIITK